MQPPKLFSIYFQKRDLALLRGLFESRVMTASHISTLYFHGKREYTKKRLQRIKAAGFIGERLDPFRLIDRIRRAERRLDMDSFRHVRETDLANEVFSPSEAEVTKARRIMEAMDQAAKEGKGAVSLDGRLIDIASIRMAEALLAKAKVVGN